MDTNATLLSCRICGEFFVASESQLHINLFEPMVGIEAELEFIRKELKNWNLNITPNDGLPQCICYSCFTKFLSIYSFYNDCEAVQKKFLSAMLPNGDPTECLQLLQNSVPTTSDINYDTIGTTNEEADGINGMQMVDDKVVTQVLNNMDVFGSDFPCLDGKILLEPSTEFVSNTMEQSNYENNNSIDVASLLNATDVNNEETINEEKTQFMSECSTKSSTTENSFNEINDYLEDLEEMLQGSIIPTKLNKKNETSINCDLNKECDASETEMYDSDENSLNSRLRDNPFACQYCYCQKKGAVDHLIFQDSEALSQHYFDAHDPNLPYTCPHCTISFKTSKIRDSHVIRMHVSRVGARSCEYCKRGIRSSKEGHESMCTYIGDWECTVCGSKFKQIPLHRFRAHQRMHERSDKYRCSICARTFVRRANMEAHEQLHLSNETKLKHCDECNSAFTSEYKLKKHKYSIHHGEMPVACEYCKKGFVSLAFLNRHMQHFHTDKLNSSNTNALTCTNCGISYTSVHKLRNHMQRQRDENGKCIDSPMKRKEKRREDRAGILLCTYCSKRFHVKSELERHLSIHDPQLRPHQCLQCNIRCRTASELKQHVKATHLLEKPHECELCGKFFTSKKNLNQHVLFHNDCTIPCTETGSHLRNVHSKELSVDVIDNPPMHYNAIESIQADLLSNGSTDLVSLSDNDLQVYTENSEQMADFFLDSLMDAENELAVFTSNN
ncbi:zinc finger protein 2-like isoform X2 [Teleopsis dalmanni]|uniref:zinc finger protein 2-like isoform X2 n=1 Tax=Teleopsis dalmanni TaxID=139649 RepID=UPI0018CD1606|nr:zinc finger protein 2-like isoform X2 [Teleopsis dalmanni]